MSKNNDLLKELNAFARAYIIAALWSSTDDFGEPLDAQYSEANLSAEALKRIKEDCEKFQADNQALLEEAAPYWSDRQAGHDFWLTRNGHGSGFWDRACSAEDRESKGEIARLGDLLTKAVKASFRECDIYVGDDGDLYIQ